MSTFSKDEVLTIFPAFRMAPDRFLFELLSISQRRSFLVNQHLYHEGDPSSAIGFLLTGSVRVYKSGETGRELTLYEYGPGETCILSASAILAKNAYPANAVTTAAGEMLFLASSDFRRLMNDHEIMRTFIFNLLSERLADVMSSVVDVAFRRLDERVLEYIAGNASPRKLFTGKTDDVAAALETSTATVQRLVKDLERRGYLQPVRGGIRVVKPTL